MLIVFVKHNKYAHDVNHQCLAELVVKTTSLTNKRSIDIVKPTIRWSHLSPIGNSLLSNHFFLLNDVAHIQRLEDNTEHYPLKITIACENISFS